MRQIRFLKRKVGRDVITIDSSLGVDLSKFQNAVDELLKQEVSVERQLVGRGRAAIVDIDGVGKVVLRQYLRGGWMKKFSKETFLNLASDPPRPVAELHVLQYLYEKGVNVPCPMGALLRTRFFGLFYTGFIATMLLEGTDNLLNVLQSNSLQEREAQRLVFLVGQEAGKMLSLRVFHPDLHLGNVLVQITASADEETPFSAKVWLIDFDKAFVFAKTQLKKYQAKTLARWIRSAEKHGVAEIATYPFEDGI